MVRMLLIMAMRSPGMLIGGIIMACSINKELALILAFVIPILAVLIGLLLKTAFPRFSAMQKKLDNLNSGIQENITNVRVIKSFVRQDFETEKFEKVLKDFFGLKVSYSVAKTAGRVNNETIYPFSNLKGHSGEIYVVALDPKKASETYKILQEYGYNEIEDFICRFPNPIVIKDYDCAMGRYEDAYGNTIEGYTGKIKSVIFRGCNNHIIIGDKVTGVQNLTFDLTANAYIEIERENRINAENRFVTRGFNGKSEVIVKRNCRLTNVLYRLYNSEYTSSIHIGEECTFESNIELHANSGKKIIIGRDCMFSHDIDMWAGDGHSIFDVTTGQNINSVYEKQLPHRNAIIIGEHVWVGKGAFIMHGTNIGTGSLIGAKSVVKGQFPNNCTISGNPARLVRKNCAWSRIMTTESITDCGKSEYYAMTREDKICLLYTSDAADEL